MGHPLSLFLQVDQATCELSGDSDANMAEDENEITLLSKAEIPVLVVLRIVRRALQAVSW